MIDHDPRNGNNDQLRKRRGGTAVGDGERRIERGLVRFLNNVRGAKVLRQGDETLIGVALGCDHDPDREQVACVDRPVGKETPTRVAIIGERLRD